jgi:hypothetical protein
MARVEGLPKVLAALQRRIDAAKKESKVSVVVGFTANYALYVHEDLSARHPTGQAKYLEQPFREMAKDLAAMVVTGVKKGLTFAQALLIAGLRLQRKSQQLVPVDTGHLRASAFTRVE